MARPVAYITAPWPTLEEIEKSYPISKASKRALQKLVDEFKAQLPHLEEAPTVSIEPEERPKRASAV
ncbi:MAG: hypothetical protein WB424_02710 [Terracidiphilus sp.]